MIDATAEHLGGALIAEGPVRSRELRTENAFDIGAVVVGELELGFVNEYLTAESAGERLATFPDVLTTLSVTDRGDHLDRQPARGRRGRGPARAEGQRPARRRSQGAERLPRGRGDARQAARRVRACLTVERIAARARGAVADRARGPAAGPTVRRTRAPRPRRCCSSPAGHARPGLEPGIDRFGNLWALPAGAERPARDLRLARRHGPRRRPLRRRARDRARARARDDCDGRRRRRPRCWCARPRRRRASAPARSARGCWSARCPRARSMCCATQPG